MTRAGPPRPAAISRMLMAGLAANGFTRPSTYSAVPGTMDPGPQSHWRTVSGTSGPCGASMRGGVFESRGAAVAGLAPGDEGAWSPRRRARIRPKNEGGAVLSLRAAIIARAARHRPGPA